MKILYKFQNHNLLNNNLNSLKDTNVVLCKENSDNDHIENMHIHYNYPYKRLYEPLGYIRNGLVAMWDGIYNTGTNKHDSSATVWVDLINGITSNTFSDQTFGDSYLNQYKTNLYLMTSGAAALLPTKPYTVEIVAEEISKSTDTNAATGVCVRNNTFGFIRHESGKMFGPACYRISNLYWSPSISGLTYSQLYPKATKTFIRNNFTPTSTSNLPSAVSVYYKGILRNTQQYTFSWGNTSSETDNIYIGGADPAANGAYRYYCIRIYNRALSSTEITHNYQIDVQRFNIT